MRVSTSGSSAGLPGRGCGHVHMRLTRRRCQPSRVSGLTPNTGHLDLGSIRLKAARRARSAGRNRGRATCRRRICSSWRRTRISSALQPSGRISKVMNASTLRSPRQTNDQSNRRPPNLDHVVRRHLTDPNMTSRKGSQPGPIEFLHPTGWNTLNGRDAVAYGRSRKSISSS